MSLRFKRHGGLLALLVLVSAFLVLGSILLSCSTGSPVSLSTVPVVAGSQATDTAEPAAAQGATDPASEEASPITATGTPPEDPDWDTAGATQITLDGGSASVNGTGAQVSGSQVTITSGGTYVIRGTLRDGALLVDSTGDLPVTLVLDGVEISSTTTVPLDIMNAEAVTIILREGSVNRLSDAGEYVLASGEDEPNAALFSRDDLTISGTGSLQVEGNFNDGIVAKDGLTIAGGTINVSSVDDGIRGKDYLVVQGGTIVVTAGGDGLKSDNAEGPTLGYILVEDGTLTITSGGDAISAQTNVTVRGGELALSSGGGRRSRIDDTASAKGIKGTASVRIQGGNLTIDSADDALHSNGTIVIDGGTFVLSSGDDALHADASLEINDGVITIGACYEGLESADITLNGGEIHVVASDDGINVSGGSDLSGMNGGPGFGGRQGGGQGGWPGQDTFSADSDHLLKISGGHLVVDASGDGIDANGSIEMSGGVAIVNGPVEDMNGALDFAGFRITGGLLIAAGSAGMAQAPGESSTQYSVLLNFGSAVRAGTLLHIQTAEGDGILTFAPSKQFESIVLSSPELEETTYDVYLGGSSTASSQDGLYETGLPGDATDIGSFSITGIVTWVGQSGRY